MDDKPLDTVLDDLAKFYILLVLNEGASHGYGIIAKYRHRTGRSLSAGTLYPFLQHLEEQEIVTCEDKPVGKRPRREYCLTSNGKKAVSRLLKRFASITAAAFESNLKVCASCGCKVYEGAHIKEINGNSLAFCCPHCAVAYQRQLHEQKITEGE
ncbi:MAG: PadR family transcriptional regulator [Candidatus Thorarchaeota archaeon]